MDPALFSVFRPSAPSWDGPFFHPLVCGCTHMTPHFPTEKHRLSVLERVGSWRMTINGCGVARLNRTRADLPPGTVLAFRQPSDMIVQPPPPVGDPWDYMWISVVGEPALAMFDHIVRRFGAWHRLPLRTPLLSAAQRLIRAARAKPDRRATEWSRLTHDFLTAWLDAAETHAAPQRLTLFTPPSKAPLAALPQTVKQFAASVGYSRSHLSRKLARQWVQSPGKLLRNNRLDDAARRLRTSDASIAAISRTIGYSSPQAFARAFAARFRQTPTAYRRATRYGVILAPAPSPR